MIKVRYIALLSIVISTYANSSNSPRVGFLYDQSGSKNAIQMDCKKINQSEFLKCDFIQTTVSYEVEPNKKQEIIQAEINKALNDTSYWDDNSVNEIKSLCSESSQDARKIKEHFKDMLHGHKKNYASKMLNIMDDACDIETVQDAKTLTIELIKVDIESKTTHCKVWPHTWTETFEKVAAPTGNYWLSKSSPTGDCGILNVSTLKKNSKYFWNYESTRLVTNKSGQTISGSCKEIEERKVFYTWKSQEHDVNCQTITFGM